ncbi:MAG: type I-D CRISPR-associated helicase Cas3' [Cyanobacteria bacterium J06592_8]
MKIFVKPLYSELNPGVGRCPLGCKDFCIIQEKAPEFKPPEGHTCPLSSHQAQTCAQVQQGEADVIFNTGKTGDGKTLSTSLPSLIDPNFRMMGLYPTIELVEDQVRQQQEYHQNFGLDAEERIDRLYGAELARRIKQENSNKFLELQSVIYDYPIILTNPDIFHLIIHHQYINPAYGRSELPVILADWPDLWILDEFPLFGPHQEAAILNSMCFIRQTSQRKKQFLFTSATPKPEFIELLRKAGFKVEVIEGKYANKPGSGYRQILQAIALEFVELKETDVSSWLTQNHSWILEQLTQESSGRGLIILNSVALVSRVTEQLKKLLPNVIVREISGRIDRKTREKIQAELKDSIHPVLVIGTSAVDVGVDFKSHLLICEGSDSATVIQRLGRLGRHPGFSSYQAIVFIPGHTPWIKARLEGHFSSEETVDRDRLNDAICDAFSPPKDFQDYRKCWGALQAEGMFSQMCYEKNAKVSQNIRDRITQDLQRIYDTKIKSYPYHWFALSKDNNAVGKATQKELLRFRGGSALQAAIWDENRFYTYDLLRLIPHANVEVINRDLFLQAAIQAGHDEEEFPDEYLQAYLRVQNWTETRYQISLHCNNSRDDLTVGELSLINKLSIEGHPQSEVETCLSRKKLLTFLVPVDRKRQSSHWDVSRTLKLSPLFGLYRLIDADEEAYACAFNQDALLLKALGWRLKKFYRTQIRSSIF